MADEVQKVKTDNPLFDFLARRPNLVGLAMAVPSTVVSLDLLHRAPLVLGVAALTYAGGFLLGADWKKAAKIQLDKSEHVEWETISDNVRDLKNQLKPYRKRLPQQVVYHVNELFAQLDELLPQWGKLKQFAEQKYALNAVVNDYLPQVLNTYLNLPASYYKDSTKARYANEITDQLELLSVALGKIQDAINEGSEHKILTQSNFLRAKFGDSGNELLKL